MGYKVLENIQTVLGSNIALYGLSDNKSQILVTGVVHGDEPQGYVLINKFMAENICGGVLFIPMLNPDGFMSGVRTNSNGVDINRNFPAKNWKHTIKDRCYGGDEPGSEIETRFLINIMEKYAPKLILTLHAPYKSVNYDGPADMIAHKISEIINYPAEKDIGYPTPGSLGTYAGIERNIPTITLELDENETMENLYLPFKKILYCLLENKTGALL